MKPKAPLVKDMKREWARQERLRKLRIEAKMIRDLIGFVPEDVKAKIRRLTEKLKGRTPTRLAGYCSLCRSKEVELYGTVLNDSDDRHVRACKEADCKHPPYYEVA